MPVEAKRLRTILWPGISATIALAILASLGTWQLQRLAWKEDLIGRIKSRAHSEPAPLPPREEWAKMASGDYEYFPVRVAGVFEHAREALVFRPAGGAEKQPGYHVMTPLELKGSGGTIFINRGFVPEALKAPSARPLGQVAGEVIVKGLLRAPEPRSMFTPGDQPTQGLWYTRDPAAMAKHFGIEHAAPFPLMQTPRRNPADGRKAARLLSASATTISLTP